MSSGLISVAYVVASILFILSLGASRTRNLPAGVTGTGSRVLLLPSPQRWPGSRPPT